MAVRVDEKAMTVALANAAWEAAAPSALQTSAIIPADWKIAFWKWYDAHQHDIILKKGFLFFKVTVEVKDIEFIFRLLFGAHP